MKKTFLNIILLLGTYGGSAWATDDLDQKYTWNLCAVGDTVNDIYRNYCVVQLPELLGISEFIKNNPVSSVNEIKAVCMEWEKLRSDPYIYQGTRDDDGNCIGEKQSDKFCDFFIKKLRDNQNKIALNFAQPGTYVVAADGSEYRAYRVVNVVLENGANVDRTDRSSPIYLINDDWKDVSILPNLTTWTPDMFINTTNINYFRSVFNNSYIYPDIDISDWLYEEYNSWDRRIPVAYSASTVVAGWIGNRYDIKNRNDVFGKYIIDGQSQIDAHTNGFMFNGKIAHLEWLGHYLIGMAQKESGLTEEASGTAIRWTQQITNRNKEGQGNAEPDHFMYANELGRNGQQILSHFSKVQTRSKEEAIALVLEYARGLGLWTTLECPPDETRCRKMPGTQDYVNCYFDGVLYKMEFDDICNRGMPEAQILTHFARVQTATKEEAINLVKEYARSLGRWSSIFCPPDETKCNKKPGTQDFVNCYFDGELYRMEFDDICNKSVLWFK